MRFNSKVERLCFSPPDRDSLSGADSSSSSSGGGSSSTSSRNRKKWLLHLGEDGGELEADKLVGRLQTCPCSGRATVSMKMGQSKIV